MAKLTVGDWGAIVCGVAGVIGALGAGGAAVGGVVGTLMQRSDPAYEQMKLSRQRSEILSETRNILAPAIKAEVAEQIRINCNR